MRLQRNQIIQLVIDIVLLLIGKDVILLYGIITCYANMFNMCMEDRVGWQILNNHIGLYLPLAKPPIHCVRTCTLINTCTWYGPQTVNGLVASSVVSIIPFRPVQMKGPPCPPEWARLNIVNINIWSFGAVATNFHFKWFADHAAEPRDDTNRSESDWGM